MLPKSLTVFGLVFALLTFDEASSRQIDFISNSERVLSQPFPEVFGKGFEGLEEEEATSNDGESGQWSSRGGGHGDEEHGVRDKSRRRKVWSQRQVKLDSKGNGEVTFKRKKHGRFEFEDGERYEEQGDKGVGREKRWSWGKNDGDDGNGSGKKRLAAGLERDKHRGRHRVNRYHHKREKKYNHVQRGQKGSEDKFNAKDIDRFKRIHQKHFGDKKKSGNTHKAYRTNIRSAVDSDDEEEKQ